MRGTSKTHSFKHVTHICARRKHILIFFVAVGLTVPTVRFHWRSLAIWEKETKVCPLPLHTFGDSQKPEFPLEVELRKDAEWGLCIPDTVLYDTEKHISVVSPQSVALNYPSYFSMISKLAGKLKSARRAVPKQRQKTCGKLNTGLSWNYDNINLILPNMSEPFLQRAESLLSDERLIDKFIIAECQAAWGALLFAHSSSLMLSPTSPSKTLRIRDITRGIVSLGVSEMMLNGVWELDEVPSFVPPSALFYTFAQHLMVKYSNEVSYERKQFLRTAIPATKFKSLYFKYVKQFEVDLLEPLEPHLRNLMYVELGKVGTTSFLPYRIVPTLPQFDASKFVRKILVDVGTNAYLGSGATMIRMYEPFIHFDEVHFFEPKKLNISERQRRKYNISEYNIITEVCSGHNLRDIAFWLRENFSEDDFIVLKYDLDNGVIGPTIEWPFLHCLIETGAIRLVDELYLELHFWFPKIGWKHQFHTMRQAFDLLRKLRELNVPVHAWP